jgi:hypothetical protein
MTARHAVSSPRKRGPMITDRWSWVPALAALGRDDGHLSASTCGCMGRPLIAFHCSLQ